MYRVRPLAALVQLTLGVQSQRMGRNYQARKQFLAQLHQNFPSRV
jgi:hypothetical protein